MLAAATAQQIRARAILACPFAAVRTYTVTNFLRNNFLRNPHDVTCVEVYKIVWYLFTIISILVIMNDLPE